MKPSHLEAARRAREILDGTPTETERMLAQAVVDLAYDLMVSEEALKELRADLLAVKEDGKG